MRSEVLAPAALEDLAAILRPDQLIRELGQLRRHECDGRMRQRVVPAGVAIPETAAELQAVVRVQCAQGSVCRAWGWDRPFGRRDACG
jgi:FAD/FMN-containing dehydrogenase